jgi:hypothetical protein
MRRRLTKIALVTIAWPLGVQAADAIADRLEAGRTPTTASKLLRRGASLGRRLRRPG